MPAPKQSIGKGLEGPVTLNNQCANPWCDKRAEQVHHICRRSYLGGPFPRVELYGKVWPNIAGVCGECHLKLELNHAVLWALEHEGRFVWRENGVSEFLDPHPVLEDGESGPDVVFPSHVVGDATGSPSSSTGLEETAARQAVGHKGGASEHADPVPRSSGPAFTASGQSESPSSPVPGSTCPECKRRVPHPRKPSSPKSKVVGFRIPVDEVDDVMEAWQVRAERLGVLKLPHWQKHYLDITNSLIDGLSDDVVRAIGRDYLGDL